MKNLFLKFISESSNFNQERISFINSVRKCSNLRPFSLINEVARPTDPDYILRDTPEDAEKFNLNSNGNNDYVTLGRFQQNTGTTLDGFFMFDNLMRQLFPVTYESNMSPQLRNILFNLWGRDLDSFNNFVNNILANNNLVLATVNGQGVNPVDFLEDYLRHFDALRYISNLDITNYAEYQLILQQILGSSPPEGLPVNTIMTMLDRLYRTGNLNYYYNYHNTMFNLLSENGINIPNISQLNNQLNNFQSTINTMWTWNGTLDMPNTGPEVGAPITTQGGTAITQGGTATTNQTMINLMNQIELYIQGNLSGEAYNDLITQLNSLQISGSDGGELLYNLRLLHHKNPELYREMMNAISHYDPENPQQFYNLISIIRHNLFRGPDANVYTYMTFSEILTNFYRVFRRLF